MSSQQSRSARRFSLVADSHFVAPEGCVVSPELCETASRGASRMIGIVQPLTSRPVRFGKRLCAVLCRDVRLLG